MVHNDGKYTGPTTADPSLRSARAKRDEVSRASFMEWVWRLLERYPADLGKWNNCFVYTDPAASRGGRIESDPADDPYHGRTLKIRI